MEMIRRLLIGCLMAIPAFAQTATLRGRAIDESGAVVPGANITLTGAGGFSKETVTAGDGSYVFTDVPRGNYTAQASAPGLALRQPVKISLRPGSQTLDLPLKVAAARQEVTVEEAGIPVLSTDAS